MATSTDVPIYTNTLASGAASVTIPLSDYQMYTSLKLVVTGQRGITGSGGAGLDITLNGDTGGNYASTLMYEGPGSLRNSNGPRLVYMGGVGDGHMVTSVIHFVNYSNTNTAKSVIGRWGSANSGEVRLAAGTWYNNAAITSITMTPPNGFAAGSTISVYGTGTKSIAKATGGAIYSDSNYWYHVFTNTAAFVPSQALTADVLVVAGGGAGNDGGGGAGGVLYTSAQSLANATSYTCTVGGGGSGSSNGTNSSLIGGSVSLSAIGGGKGGEYNAIAAGNGGSGGGAARISGAYGTSTSGQGNRGGSAWVGGGNGAGGGGGAGAIGGDNSGATGGAGGVGTATYNSWSLATGIGELVSGTYYIAGGGGGFGGTTAGLAGYGGGGTGSQNSGNGGTNGLANTGGGGGGRAGSVGWGSGGSGVVIVRYAK